MVLFFCNKLLPISGIGGTVKKELVPIIIFLLVIHAFAAILFFAHFGTVNLFQISDLDILRVELEVGAVAFALFGSKELLQSHGNKRIIFALVLIIASAIHLATSFLGADIFNLFINCLCLAWGAITLFRWKEKSILIAEILD